MPASSDFYSGEPIIDRRSLYLESHGVNAAVHYAVDLAVSEGAADPIARIAEVLNWRAKGKNPAAESLATRVAELEKQNAELRSRPGACLVLMCGPSHFAAPDPTPTRPTPPLLPDPKPR